MIKDKTMIEQRKDAPGNSPYWVCTKCNWAFPVLREATSHQCETKNKTTPAYVSYSRKK